MNTQSLYLTDIAHHHLACGILFVWASHVYSSSLKAFGYKTRDVLFVSTTTLPTQSTGFASRPLAFALGSCSTITSVVGEHIYSLRPYLNLSYDSCGSVAHWVHHSWIAEFLMMASNAHFAISFISDSVGPCQPIVIRILAHKGALLSSLSGCCLWLGFQTFAVYCHNDTIVTIVQSKMIIFSSQLQHFDDTHALSCNRANWQAKCCMAGKKIAGTF